MTKVPPLKDNGEKRAEENIKNRIQGLFSKQDDIPAPMSIHEMEALKNRVAELEAALAKQPEVAEKKTLTPPETAPSPLPTPPPNNTELGVNSPIARPRWNILPKITGLLDRLSYPRKFIIISLLFLLPLLVFYPLVKEQLQRIEDYGYQELRGADYLYALDHLLNDVQTYQIEAAKFYANETSLADLQAYEDEVDISFEELIQVHTRNGAILGLGNEPSQLIADWEVIKSSAAEQQPIGSQPTELATNILDLIFKVGNNSYLILDPDLDTYYAMDAVLQKIPESQTLLSQILDVSGEATRVRKLTPQQSAQLTTLVGQLRANLETLNTNIGVALQNDKSGRMQPLIEPLLSSYSTSVSYFLNNVERQVITPSSTTVEPGTLLTDGQQVMVAQEALFDGVSQALQIGIQGRISALTNRLILGLSLVLITAIIAFVIGLSIMRAISLPLQSLTLAAQQLATGNTTARAKVLSSDEVGQTAAAFNAMADRLSHTLTILTARTRDLTLAAEVGQNISEMRDVGGLLTSAVELIRNRFDLYYAQVYLLDNSGQNLVLRAGTGNVGQELLMRGFRLPVDTASLNGIAVVEQRAVIVSNTGQTPNFRPNPLLPNTRSEMCVPLLSADRVIGVLDLQSEHPDAFSGDNLPVFDTLTSQLTIALQNATLYTQAEEARSEMESQVRYIKEQGWQNFLNAIERGHKIGFAFDQRNLTPLQPENIVTSTAEMFSAPMTVTGAKIGTIQFSDEPDRTWSENEIELVHSIADQLAQHIDNLRLLAQAEKYRLEAEQITRRLTRDGWGEYIGNRDADLGYIYNLNEVKSFSDNGNHATANVLKQALSVRDETVGELMVSVENAPDDVKEIVESIARQLSGHIETLRLSEELLKRAKELEELDRLKSAFLANMSHELRTPLNSILGFTDVMLEGLDGSLTDYMDNDLRLIQKNGQHLLHLINDVLDMAKIESGRMNLDPENFKVHRVFDEAISITSTFANEKKLSLLIDESSDPEIGIYADNTRLRQVMINLVNNAIKFTDTGKIALSVSRMDDARVLIKVKDTGMGISPSQLETVFQEFSQVDTSTTRKAGGTGLGLPISRRLVEMHGGRLWVESTGVEGEGSTFLIEMPIEARITEVVEKKER